MHHRCASPHISPISYCGRRAGCEFADARYLDIRRQRVMSRDHALPDCNDSEDCGFGVRVLYNGAWSSTAPCRPPPASLPDGHAGAQGGGVSFRLLTRWPAD